MNLYKVTLIVGMPLGSEVFEVRADGHTIESSGGSHIPPFIVFYRGRPSATPAHGPDLDDRAKCICGGYEVDGFTAPELVDSKLAAHIAAANEATLHQEVLFAADPRGGPVPTRTDRLEVFRAPLPGLVAVQLVDETVKEADE